MRRRGSDTERGQASVELLAILPALIGCVVVAAHVLPSGWALWSAADAARVGARAEHVGAEGAAAARDALPAPLRPGERRAERLVGSGAKGVSVEVEVPGLLPGLDVSRVRAAAWLEPEPP